MSPSRNSSWPLSNSIRTFSGWFRVLVMLTGMVLVREVRVMRNWSGSTTAPLSEPSSVLTRSTYAGRWASGVAVPVARSRERVSDPPSAEATVPATPLTPLRARRSGAAMPLSSSVTS
jgi:hypothetical protein